MREPKRIGNPCAVPYYRNDSICCARRDRRSELQQKKNSCLHTCSLTLITACKFLYRTERDVDVTTSSIQSNPLKCASVETFFRQTTGRKYCFYLKILDIWGNLPLFHLSGSHCSAGRHSTVLSRSIVIPRQREILMRLPYQLVFFTTTTSPLCPLFDKWTQKQTFIIFFENCDVGGGFLDYICGGDGRQQKKGNGSSNGNSNATGSTNTNVAGITACTSSSINNNSNVATVQLHKEASPKPIWTKFGTLSFRHLATLIFVCAPSTVYSS